MLLFFVAVLESANIMWENSYSNEEHEGGHMLSPTEQSTSPLAIVSLTNVGRPSATGIRKNCAIWNLSTSPLEIVSLTNVGRTSATGIRENC